MFGRFITMRGFDMSQQQQAERKQHREGLDQTVEKRVQLLRDRAASQYVFGDEQHTIFSWAGGVDGRWSSTVEIGNVRRYLRNLAVIAVGYSGCPDKNSAGAPELVTAIAPVRFESLGDAGGVDVFIETPPEVRTFSKSRNFDRHPFGHIEERWTAAAGFLAEQLMTLLTHARGESIRQNHLLYGKTAVRFPKLTVTIPGETNADGIPSVPQYVHLDTLSDSQLDQLMSLVTPELVCFDMDTLGHAYDIRGWDKSNQRLRPEYSVCPWFVMPTNIRTVFADVGVGTARWWM